MEMEICGKLIGQSNPGGGGGGRDHQNPTTHNINLSNSWAPNHHHHNIWEMNSSSSSSSRFDLDWPICPADHTTNTTRSEPIWLQPHHDGLLYGGAHFHPDPHLMCLKLGKRHYFEDATASSSPMPMPTPSVVGKRGKAALLYGGEGGGGGVPITVPRCQVEGCHVALVNAKDYHRRHRVCEMHSKAPKVVVVGLEQRFCQQCSRFHVISEFDDSKRSCRRRLAGHNERRRKSSHDSVAPRNHCSQENKSITGRIAYLPSPTGRALSLLSSKNESWATSSELSLRSSAALRELIAENRAAILARQLILDRDWHSNHTAAADDFCGGVGFHHHHQQQQQQQQEERLYCEQQSWERMHDENGGAHVTLDLMQAPSTAFGMLSVRGKSKEEDEECCELWNSFHDQESHVV